jgi:hypothetical protein
MVVVWAALALAGEWPRELRAYQGTTPTVDGVIAPGEWDDATTFTGTKDWTPQFTPITDPADLSVKGYVKYDDQRLYFAFDVTDDVLYGIDSDRWLPDKNPKAHELTREGWPWFGDEMELLINAANRWSGDENAAGNGSSWQMVCNLTKSRLGGIGVGGLLEGRAALKEGGVGHIPEVDPDPRDGSRRQGQAWGQGLRHRVGRPLRPVPGGRARTVLCAGRQGGPHGPEHRPGRP